MAEPLASGDLGGIRKALRAGDYPAVITQVRQAMAVDPVTTLADPAVNEWCGRRYRNLFIEAAAVDEHAIAASQGPFPMRLLDHRSDRERVARRFLRDVSDDEITTEMPPAATTAITDTTLVFCPGLLTGLLPVLAFQSVWPRITERYGVRILAADSHPMRSASANVADLVNAIERGIGVAPDPEATLITADDDPAPPGDVLLMGYSKGSPDALSLLVERPDLAPRIRAVIGWAGAIGGSFVANDIYGKIKDLPTYDAVKDLNGRVGELVKQLVPIVRIEKIDRRLDEYDIKGALLSLTTFDRDAFIRDNADHFAELGVPMLYFSGSTSPWEVPYFQVQGTLELDRYDMNNDMQLTQSQARPPVPNPPHLAMFHANHWDLSYDAFPWYTTLGSQHLKHPFPKYAAMAALVEFLNETGLLT